MPSGRGVGYWLPRILVLACVADLAARFYPVQRLSFRGWEALSRYPEPDAGFEADGSFVNERSYGDLSALGNLPERRLLRPDRFTTNAQGHRNLPSAEVPDALLVGDSFAVGVGLNDEETLPVLLGRETGERVYNAGRGPRDPRGLLALAERLGMKRGRIYYQFGGPDYPPRVPSRSRTLTRDVKAGLPRGVVRAWSALRGYFEVSTLEILAGRVLRRVQDGVILPNPAASRVEQAVLLNGDWMLFRAGRPEPEASYRTPSGAYWSWMDGELRGRGFEVVVLLVPIKPAVYGPLRNPPEPHPNLVRLHADLEADLKERGVPVVNFGPVLARAAREGLATRDYVYWQDDTHWNPAGVALAARAAAEQLRARKPR
jgi:hypothetical protein